MSQGQDSGGARRRSVPWWWMMLSVAAVVACVPLGVVGVACLVRAVRAIDRDDRHQFTVWWTRSQRWTAAAMLVGLLALAIIGSEIYRIHTVGLVPYCGERPCDG